MKRFAYVFAGVALLGCAPGGESLDLGEAADESGSALTTAEQALVLEVANSATLAELDGTAELDARAAENIVAERPFTTFAELDAVPYVGTSALAKLLDYAEALAPSERCLVISEYIEGQGNYNKAIELYNCGSEPIGLSEVGVCLVRNGDTTCTFTGKLPDTDLAPGDVFGVCRKKSYTMNDPYVWITNGCDHELPGVMTFDGDDRLLVFADSDGSGKFSASDSVLDSFGVIAARPPSTYWADKVYRRCDVTPFDGTAESAFSPWEHFTQHARTAMQDYGFAPTADGCP